WKFATQNAASRFLPHAAPAEWILYPVPPEVDIQSAVERNAVFRRAFSVEAVPRVATLQVRAYEQCRVSVNGTRLEEAVPANRNWKQVRTWDVAGQLRPGNNEISVAVTNSQGPPVLWLALTANGQLLSTDEQWQVSLEGAVTRPARFASAP